jgi:hypothetical protein
MDVLRIMDLVVRAILALIISGGLLILARMGKEFLREWKLIRLAEEKSRPPVDYIGIKKKGGKRVESNKIHHKLRYRRYNV